MGGGGGLLLSPVFAPTAIADERREPAGGFQSRRRARPPPKRLQTPAVAPREGVATMEAAGVGMGAWVASEGPMEVGARAETRVRAAG